MAPTTTTIIGNLTSDPDLKHFEKSASDKGRLRVAVNRRVKDRNDNWIDADPLYINIELWGSLAVNAKQSLIKGMPIIATGTLVTQAWEDKEGNNRQQVLLKGSHVGLDLTRYVIGSKRSDQAEKNSVGVEVPEPVIDRSLYNDFYTDQGDSVSGVAADPGQDSGDQLPADTGADAAASANQGEKVPF
ncbi:single-stranded DNA-binding protein [Corynebacterium alimapuense]|uniref:Single-stranded DNA-binding protein n=1 Tax=Corynebacterium alimapuense TaxID=1576874 RepID=A0A3M8K929_9CORY|nr:single-stranded DNA-binding protein [Corynebacterium alimapuense]RNE49670.1 hypothetical protein C5L39_04870 [Corynebacterium alimapuense]